MALDTFHAAGGEIVPDAHRLDPTFPREPAIVFRFRNPLTGEPLTFTDPDGRANPFIRVRRLVEAKQKFLQPKQSGTHVYFARLHHRSWQSIFEDPATHIVISEGETRALAGAVYGIPVIGLTGVWCGQQKGKLHPDLDPVHWQGRSVYLAFDSDVSRKEDVQRALRQIAGLLAERGAVVRQVIIPPAPDGSKQGLDDYLAKYGRESFIALTASPECTLFQPTGAELLGQTGGQQEELSLPELLKRAVTPVKELIPGWIEKGVPNFLAGPGGVHKSRLALQWGLCVAENLLGSGLIDQSQKMTAAAMQMADIKVCAHRS